MKKSLLYFGSFLILILISCGKDDPIPEPEDPICGVDLYIDDLFSNIQVATVQYGSNTNVNGSPKDLFMDIYTPEDFNNNSRPVMIWLFGGAFISGERTDMDAYAKLSAQKGYVAVTADYRILEFNGTIPDSLQGLDISIKAMHDIKAAIRFLRKNAAEGNPYGIDPTKIFIGGVSAGAITALEVAMVKEDEITENHIKQVIQNNGGFEGSSNSIPASQFSSAVQGVISLSGAIYRLDWVDASDPPILSFHGDADEVVPYEYDFTRVFNVPIIPLYGSKPIHDRATAIGLRNELITVPGGDHVLIYTSSDYANVRTDLNKSVVQFLAEEICK